MCITLNFTFKDYQLVIGPDRRNSIVERYVFDGWTDESQRERFHGSIGFLEAEAIAGRTEPSLFKSAVYRIDSGNESEQGSVIGSIIEANYNTAYHDTAFIEEFFKKVRHRRSSRRAVS